MKPTVISIKQTNTLGTTGNLQVQYVVQFSVGPHGPFTITVPADQFTAANVQAEMNKIAAEVAQLAPAS